MNCFKESISKNVHDHSFSNIILELSLNCHWVQLRSYATLGLGFWFSAYPIIPSFKMAFDILSLALCTRLNLPHPIVHNFSQCICSQPIDSTRIHLLCCDHWEECVVAHDIIWDSFASIVRDVRFHVLHEQTHVP
jgi:hypothetical protein